MSTASIATKNKKSIKSKRNKVIFVIYLKLIHTILIYMHISSMPNQQYMKREYEYNSMLEVAYWNEFHIHNLE